jgi:CRP-like cAMP-binding protein
MYHPGMDGVGSAIEALERVQLFAGLDRTSLERLATGLRTRRFRRNEVLFHQGDPGDSLFIVTAGAVKIVLPSEEGDEAILATVRPGAFFGELALLDGAPRSATAIAMEPTETLVLPRDRFRLLIDTEPATRDALLAALAGELRRLTDHVEELHFLDMTGRMAARLLRLAQGAGAPASDGSIRLDGSYTQGDLASMIGATRQSVNKLLGQFVDDELIRVDPDAIVIIDLPRLERTARR